MGTIISASDLTVSQIQNGIVIVDQDTKDYANNTIEWQVLGKDQDGNGTITIQAKTGIGDNTTGGSSSDVGHRRYDSARNKLDSELQVWLDTDFYNHIGSNLKSAIIPTTKAITPYQSGDISSRECKLFNLSVAEVGGYDLSGSAPERYTPEPDAFTYQYYQGIESTGTNQKRSRMVDRAIWWLRSPSIVNDRYVWDVYSDGQVNNGNNVYDTVPCPCPACVLPSTIQLEEVETGKYNIVWSGGGGNEKTLHVLGCGKTSMDQQTHFVLNPTTGDWDEKTLPYDHMDNGTNAIVYDNEIHVFGGFYESNRLKHYKWLGDSWEEVSTLPYPCDYTSAVVYNGELHILGGRHSGAIYKHYKWNGVSWSEVSTLPDSFSGINFAVVYNNEIHVLSGDTANKHFKWNGTQWTEVSTLPYNPKDNVDDTQTGIVVYDGKIHILGGRAQEVQRYHYAWDGTSWSSVSTLPSDIGNEPAAVVFDNKIHIFNNGLSTTSKHYSWDGTSWSSEDDVPWYGSTGAKILVYEYGYAGKGEKKYLDKNGTQHLIDKIKADKEDKFRFSTMPTASADWLGKTVEYTGTTTSSYTHSKRYECQVVPESDPTAYKWVVEAGSTQDARIGEEITKIGVRVDSTLGIAIPYISVNPTKVILPFSSIPLSHFATIIGAYYDGEVTLADLQDAWSVGDTRTISISATESTATQDVTLTIVDFNHDTLTTAEGEITKSPLTLAFTIDETLGIGEIPYSSSAFRTFLDEDMLEALPSELQGIIKQVVKSIDNGASNGSVYSTNVNSKVFIPACREFIGRGITAAEVVASGYSVLGGTSNYGTSGGGTKYALYNNENSISKSVAAASCTHWSNPNGFNQTAQVYITTSNTAMAHGENTASGIMPHFCV